MPINGGFVVTAADLRDVANVLHTLHTDVMHSTIERSIMCPHDTDAEDVRDARDVLRELDAANELSA